MGKNEKVSDYGSLSNVLEDNTYEYEKYINTIKKESEYIKNRYSNMICNIYI